jgi:hypothetical protein
MPGSNVSYFFTGVRCFLLKTTSPKEKEPARFAIGHLLWLLEVLTTWLNLPHDQQDSELRDNFVKRFKLLVEDTPRLIQDNDSAELKLELKSLEQLLLNSFKLVSKGSTWAKVWRIDLTKTGTKEIV